MTIPELSKADRRGEIAAHVTGTLSLPDATAKISIRDAALLGRHVPRLDVQADATNLRGALDAHVSQGESCRNFSLVYTYVGPWLGQQL
jgi:translocation and assembly module TamB